ncbi:peptidoglycan-binding protein [Marilutibacter alkalisoli]|uniref:Lytic enzyme n=1 Tax=Marilutibacter alkalisoli TaxID=2591633 RepID=A0A514BVJ6_9GAMM|nr:peptidoglycan-binding protein [Lysobacter alkalisoli]QDH71335.1 lytic enzyme [Lysobacter alkalisoli]
MATDRETQLLSAAYEAGITSPRELANFMAQVSAESGGLNRLNESFRYSGGPETVSNNVRSALRQGPEALNAAWREAMDGRPEPLAELMYGGRMGNNEPGDGYEYRGRGYIQLTGKNQYRAAGEALDLDLVNQPELAAEPENAARIAIWYWQENVQARAPESVREAGSIINTGAMGNTPNGLGHREAEFAKWQRTLTPEVMEQLAQGEIGAIQGARRPSVDPLADGVLRNGEKGEPIRELQQDLHALGYTGRNGQPLTADGDFGANTEHAVRAYQRDHGLTVDGIVGPRTLESIQQQQQEQSQTQPTTAAQGATSAIDRLLAGQIDPAAQQAWNRDVAACRPCPDPVREQEAQQQAQQQDGMAR